DEDGDPGGGAPRGGGPRARGGGGPDGAGGGRDRDPRVGALPGGPSRAALPDRGRTNRPADHRPAGRQRARAARRARSVLDEAPESAAPQRRPQLAERLGLDLPDALPGHIEPLADLLEGVLAFLPDPEPEPQDLRLLLAEPRQGPLDLGGEVLRQERVGRRRRALVLDEVAEIGVLADRGLERQRLLARLQDQAHLPQRQRAPLRQL